MLQYYGLQDLATLVKERKDFVVFEAKTGKDITRSVLAQIDFENNIDFEQENN